MTRGDAGLGVIRPLAAGAGLGLVCSALPGDVPVALAVLLVLVLPVGLWLALWAPRGEASVLLPIVVGAVAVRAGISVALAHAVPADYFALDHLRYQWVGWQLAEHWAGRAAAPSLLTDKAGYYVWNALIFTAVGYVPLAAAMSNAAVAGVSVILSYRIASDLAGPSAARWAALFAAGFPSLILWSSLNLKDAFAILAILTALRGAQRLQSSLSPGAAVQLAAGVLWLAELRGYLVAMVLIACGCALVVPRLRGVAAKAAIVAAIALSALVGELPEPVEKLAGEASFEALDQHRRNLALGDSVYHADADVSTAGAALRFLPVGLAWFLMAPAPWQLFNARQWITLPEMLVWYALLPQVFFGARHLWRRRHPGALPFAIFAVLATVSYALVESNLGTAYRHRAQVLILYLVFAAVGVATRPERRAARAPHPALSEAHAT